MSDFFPQLLSLVKLFGYVWWIVIPLVLWITFWHSWLHYIRMKYLASVEWVLLEVLIPKEVLRTPKAMEQVFAGIYGAFFAGTFIDKYWDGKMLGWFSLELVSLSGQTHFYVRTPTSLRNLIESQIYGQYPRSEIFEVPDYINIVPNDAPNDKWDLWGTDMMLAKTDAYPIRTYEYFFGKEGSVKEEFHLDPLSSLMEALGNLKEGENVWLQVLIQPAGEEWKKEVEDIVNKIAGKKSKPKPPSVLEEVGGLLSQTIKFVTPSGEASVPTREKDAPQSTVMFLSPGERDVLASVEQSASKPGYETKIRFIYAAQREAFNRGNVAAVMGFFRHFNTQHLNSFKPNFDTMTVGGYFFSNQREYIRKRRLLENYRRRWLAENPNSLHPKGLFVFNTEELATIYHFPGMATVAPSLPRIGAKKGEPPNFLPVV
ncbi:MAG: hypothetical protein AAB824_01720 [Patescibacteria group bacterium]